MELVRLQVNTKTWVTYFLVISTLFTVTILFLADGFGFKLPLYSAAIASVLVVGMTIAFFYYYQKEVILTDSEIKKAGIPSRSLAYIDIRKIMVGFFGYRVYGKDGGAINISKIYSNFNEANQILNQQIKDFSDIEIIGAKLIVNKYFNQE